MLKKFNNSFLILLVLLVITACGGGGSGSVAIESNSSSNFPAKGTKSGSEYCGSGDNQYNLYQNYHDGNGGTTTTLIESNSTVCGYTAPVVDNRIKFEDFTDSFNDIYGESSVTYTMSEWNTDLWPDNTDTYEIGDFGFLKIQIDGRHNGSDEGAESTTPGPFTGGGYWYEANLNNDTFIDMLFVGHTDGALDWVPGIRALAWINDGYGHFELDPYIFENQEFPCVYGNGPQIDSTNINSSCGFTQGNNFPIVKDFNGDGITDYFNLSQLLISDNGVIKNKSQQNIPDMFFQEHIGPIFAHRFVSEDIDNDGDLDIFVPINQSTKSGYKLDGTIDSCSGCNQTVPWVMLINDGNGVFSMNTNFNQPTWIYAYEDILIWPTATAIGDFNNDGYQDVVVGWENPKYAKDYGWEDNSSGNIYINNGNSDWRTQPINLPPAWFGDNSIIVDMQVIDFNQDGALDIVMQVTKHQPYYQANVIQFLQNDGYGNFTDVTTNVNSSYSKYENGSGTDWWNGGGILHILDYDNDGDNDIVSTNGRSYVLINNNGSFDILDDFPIYSSGDGGGLWPIKINSDYYYDFIGQAGHTESDSRFLNEFYQILSK